MPIAQEEARAALHHRIVANRFVAVATVIVIALTVYFWFREASPSEHTLRMTAGDPLSHRYGLAVYLQEEAAKHGLKIEITDTAGSQEALSMVAAGDLDVAMALGDFDIPDEHLRQVAVFNTEAMHLFVKPEFLAGGLQGLRGKTLSLGATGSSSHKMSRRLLEFVGLHAGRDFTEIDLSNNELMNLPREQLPDAIFAITSLPWVEVGERLVHKLGYRLMDLPFGDTVALRNPSVHDFVIPAYSYGIEPPVPDHPLHTMGQRLLVVANRDTPSGAIERLMSVIFESEFGRRARLPSLTPATADDGNEFPMHAGAIKYLHRNEPLIKADSIDKLENLRSFLVSAAVAIFLFWRWQKRRNLIGFETYIDAISELEMAALKMENTGFVDYAELHRMRVRLSELKSEALERAAEGVLRGEENMSSFLAHVADVRNYLDSLLSREPQPPADERASRPSLLHEPNSLQETDNR